MSKKSTMYSGNPSVPTVKLEINLNHNENSGRKYKNSGRKYKNSNYDKDFEQQMKKIKQNELKFKQLLKESGRFELLDEIEKIDRRYEERKKIEERKRTGSNLEDRMNKLFLEYYSESSESDVSEDETESSDDDDELNNFSITRGVGRNYLEIERKTDQACLQAASRTNFQPNSSYPNLFSMKPQSTSHSRPSKSFSQSYSHNQQMYQVQSIQVQPILVQPIPVQPIQVQPIPVQPIQVQPIQPSSIQNTNNINIYQGYYQQPGPPAPGQKHSSANSGVGSSKNVKFKKSSVEKAKKYESQNLAESGRVGVMTRVSSRPMAEVRPEAFRHGVSKGFGSMINPIRSTTTAKVGHRVKSSANTRSNPTQAEIGFTMVTDVNDTDLLNLETD